VSYGKEAGPNTMTDGAVWRLDTRSGAWADITPEKPGQGSAFGYGSVAVDAAHPDTVLTGTWSHYNPFDEVYRSTDGGRTWASLLDHAEWDHSSAPYTKPMNHHWLADLKIDPFDSNHAMFTTGFGVWATHDLGDADAGRRTLWAFEDQGIEETVPTVLASPPSGPHLLSGVADVDGFRHDDLSVSPPSGRFGTPAFKNTARPGIRLAPPRDRRPLGQHLPQRPGDGRLFARRGRDLEALRLGAPRHDRDVLARRGRNRDLADGKTVVWSPTGVAPHLTQDWGATWFPSVGGSVNLAVVADTVNPSKFYAYDTEAGTLVVSTDGARSFKARAGGLPIAKGRWGPAPGTVVAVPGREGEFWVIANGFVIHSTDSGASVAELKGVDGVAYRLWKSRAGPRHARHLHLRPRRGRRGPLPLG
jgi:hypothetical protein